MIPVDRPLTIEALCRLLPGLTAAPAGVLLALHLANGRYLSEAAIFEAVEGVTGNRDTTHAANSAIKFARKALRQHGAGSIECRALVGWRLIWNPEWRDHMTEQATPVAAPQLTASVARKDDSVFLITHDGEAIAGRLRMTRPQAIDLARLLIRAAK